MVVCWCHGQPLNPLSISTFFSTMKPNKSWFSYAQFTSFRHGIYVHALSKQFLSKTFRCKVQVRGRSRMHYASIAGLPQIFSFQVCVHQFTRDNTAVKHSWRYI